MFFFFTIIGIGCRASTRRTHELIRPCSSRSTTGKENVKIKSKQRVYRVVDCVRCVGVRPPHGLCRLRYTNAVLNNAARFTPFLQGLNAALQPITSTYLIGVELIGMCNGGVATLATCQCSATDKVCYELCNENETIVWQMYKPRARRSACHCSRRSLRW